jgi:hypothetical protein
MIRALTIVVLFASAVAAASPDEFFILSSVDTAKSRLILKRPTDVTVVMAVSGRTAIRGERGESLQLANLRAGDTIYVIATTQSNGELMATGIRRGPMTVEELHRRYIRR